MVYCALRIGFSNVLATRHWAKAVAVSATASLRRPPRSMALAIAAWRVRAGPCCALAGTATVTHATARTRLRNGTESPGRR